MDVVAAIVKEWSLGSQMSVQKIHEFWLKDDGINIARTCLLGSWENYSIFQKKNNI